MIPSPDFLVEPWQLRESTLNLDLLAQSESLFALSNGHIGWRGNLDEGEPFALPGSYLNGVHEVRPLPYAERGYGNPEDSQTVINVTNGKVIRLLVDDEPLDLRYGTLVSHERTLDFRTGCLTREIHWVSPAGKAVKVRSTRLVSFTQRAVAAIGYEVEAVDQSVRVVIQSELIANEELPAQSDDPRSSAVLARPLNPVMHAAHGTKAVLVHRVEHSGLGVAAAMDHTVFGDDELPCRTEIEPDLGRFSIGNRLAPGQKLGFAKFVAYGWSSTRSVPALRDQVEAALAAAKVTGWDAFVAEQKEFLDNFWRDADVEVDGDAEVQQAVRFALFHVLQAAARGERRAIAAKGLTGPGYDGHAFWDTEMLVLPVLTYTYPEAVSHALWWRHDTMPLALDRAQQLGFEGAAFPWRTITGAECSGYWPAGTAAFHLNAAVAAAVTRYVSATGDEEFAATAGIELLVQTARLWRSLGHHNSEGRFCIDGVTGPDEYSAIADNNVYTNLMAKRNLLAAYEYVHRFPDRARQLGVGEEESAAWHDAAKAVLVPYDETLGVHPQSDGFTRHQEWDFARSKYPLLLNHPYFEIYRKQVVKQADLVLAIMQCPEEFTPEQKARDFDYYERITVRDSSLSACVQAVVAAEVGQLQLAHDYLAEAALMDIADLEHNTADGLHIASLAGAWVALVNGLGGLRQDGGMLHFSPRLPPGLSRLKFSVRQRDSRLRVTITPASARYEVDGPDDLTIVHHGRTVHLAEPQELPIPAPPRVRPSQQPPGRAPRRRDVEES
ncbi:glycosyl hydrolase family 65 protein [Kutzneria sp. NPDC051319]|uniref:glycoside hydrolase family 65 protein n=1 Tax=Kutzneria sp. NPDC051319 TaxID=3155047 RepID=UPI00342BB702